MEDADDVVVAAVEEDMVVGALADHHPAFPRAAAGDVLDDVAGKVDEVDTWGRRGLHANGEEEGGVRVAGGVRGGEERVGGEGPPRVADGAEAADGLGGEAKQDLVQHLRWQDAINHGSEPLALADVHRRAAVARLGLTAAMSEAHGWKYGTAARSNQGEQVYSAFLICFC